MESAPGALGKNRSEFGCFARYASVCHRLSGFRLMRLLGVCQTVLEMPLVVGTKTQSEGILGGPEIFCKPP